MRNILLINNGLSGGGTERASISFAHYLVEQGFEVAVLALYQSIPFYKLDSRVKFIEPTFSRSGISTYRYIMRMMSFVRKNVKTLRPDTILSYNEWTNAYVVLACLGLNVPLYISERMHPKAKLPFSTELLRQLLYRKASGVVAQTAFGKRIIQQKTKAKNVVAIPNAVNVILPLNVIKRKQIVAVGRLEKVKGHRFLLEAFAKIKNSEWKLCIVGDGSEKDTLIQLTRDLNISNRVEFKGHLLDFRKELSESEIYVLPSIKEGFPNSLIEAMSLPLACISGDFYEGEHDLVKHEFNGLLVPPENTIELAKAIDRLIEDDTLRESIAQKAFHVREELAFDRVSEELKNFIILDEKHKKELK